MKVGELKNLNFSQLSLNEQLAIKNSGRPTPLLRIVQEQPQCKNKNAFTRKFDKNIYNKFMWICGCEERNSFFCFVCLLFGGDDNWTGNGVNDLKHITLKTKKHENSVKHRDSLVSFQLLGKGNIATRVSAANAVEIRKHNDTVTKNRHVLSKIIDILKVCGACSAALRKDSNNRGVFLELVDFLASVDCTFNSHIQEATIMKDTSGTIQKEILQCMLEVCREHILQEIQKSSYLAVMVEDTTDVATHAEKVIVFRYELNGKLFERFWTFANPKSQNINGLSECILEHISSALKDHPEKLIGQTYDGATLREVYVKVQEQYKNAHFVYCYAHQFNKILEQAVSNINSVRIFFAHLNGISVFFSQSPDRMAALQHVSDKRTPSASPTRWNFDSCAAQCVYNNKDEILECFEDIISGIPKKYDTETMIRAAGLVKWLEDKSFFFWLTFFSKIMPHVDILFSQLQKNETEVARIQSCIEHFKKKLTYIKDNLSPKSKESKNIESSRKRRRLSKDDINRSVREVCDILCSEVRSCFSFRNYICGETLFLKENYEKYKQLLPLKDVDKFCEAYPMIDKEVLKMELFVFYSRKEITEQHSENSFSGCLETLNFITSFGLDTAFQEIVKVLKLLVTIPMTTSETERCFSTSKLIKSFLKNTVEEESLTALAMLSIEKLMVQKIPNFNEKVIEKFIADKNRRMDFHYNN